MTYCSRRNGKCPAANKRFGAMAAEARNNGSGEFEISCAAERVVEAATAAKPPPRCEQLGESAVDNI